MIDFLKSYHEYMADDDPVIKTVSYYVILTIAFIVLAMFWIAASRYYDSALIFFSPFILFFPVTMLNLARKYLKDEDK